MINENKKLRQIVKKLVLELDQLKVPVFRGNGTSHPYIIKSPKQNLGYVENAKEMLPGRSKKAVSVSRAFNKS
jgi:hypothetical protein